MSDASPMGIVERLRNHSKRPPGCDCVRCEAADEITRMRTAAEAIERDAAELSRECPFCKVPRSTGACDHLIRLSDARVAMRESVWDELILDRIALREMRKERDGRRPFPSLWSRMK